MEVAVKVMQHSQAAAASVANEVDLMMSFSHPNLVSALHFVTWRRRKDRSRDSPSSNQQQVCVCGHVDASVVLCMQLQVLVVLIVAMCARRTCRHAHKQPHFQS